MNQQEFSIAVGDKKLTVIVSNLADQTNGSVLVKMGETVVLATAVLGTQDREELDYFPLTVDYEERFYAAGLLLGGKFVKREGKPSDEAILSGRAIDRCIRPLFDHSLRREVQIIVTVLSFDGEYDPGALGIIGASCALGISDIPWNGPVGALRISVKKDGSTIINQAKREKQEFLFDALLSEKEGFINMIEAGALEASPQIVEKALKEALLQSTALETFQAGIIKKIGKQKQKISGVVVPDAIKTFFDRTLGKEGLRKKLASSPDTKKVLAEIQTFFSKKIQEENLELDKNILARYIDDVVDELVHDMVLAEGKRPDGRTFDEVRSLFTQAGGISEQLHGVGIFYRGGTHVLSVLTLGGPHDAQLIEGMEVRTKKHFLHHYNFPHFSTGEIGRVGGGNRRSIGHGALAERALAAVIPSLEIFPYTIRLVAESLASNGSTSMGSVCAGSLALADGGVPISRHVAGIAMGLMMQGKNYQLLTDIQGPEDHYGDMDFKVAGTREGITALQLDVKVEGVPLLIITEALAAAEKARLTILSTMEKALPAPRPNVNPHAPVIARIQIPEDKIGMIIGPSGKTIKKLCAETETLIEIDDTGKAFITGKQEAVRHAQTLIEAMTKTYKPGDAGVGIVRKVLDFGAVVELAPGIEGLVHISELAPFRVQTVTDVVCPGESVPVIVIDIDERGRLKLSIVKQDPNFAKNRGQKKCADTNE